MSCLITMSQKELHRLEVIQKIPDLSPLKPLSRRHRSAMLSS